MYLKSEFDHRILALQNSGLNGGIRTLTSAVSAPPVDLSDQLGAGRYVGRL